jgi:hypothetical protein
VVLIRIDEELGWDATHAGCIEGAHALVGIDTVILFAVDAEDWSIPLVYKLMRTVLVGLLGVGTLVLVPVSILVFPVREPSLLCIGVHALQVESTIVREECLETLVVMTGEIVYRETTETGTDTAQTILVYVRKIVGSIINS